MSPTFLVNLQKYRRPSSGFVADLIRLAPLAFSASKSARDSEELLILSVK
jgi:hypothetical protein